MVGEKFSRGFGCWLASAGGIRVHSTLRVIFLKIWASLSRPMAENLRRPNPEAVSAGTKLPLGTEIFVSLLDLLAMALQSALLALNNLVV